MLLKQCLLLSSLIHMETTSRTAFAAADPDLLHKHNYAEWEIQVRTYLKGQDLWEDLVGIRQLHERKKIHIQSNELLSCMREVISRSHARQLTIGGVYDAINHDVKNGIFKFVFKIMRMDPRILENEDRNSRNMFMLAVLYRQPKIFRLIYGLDIKNTLTSYEDRQNDDNMLHMAGIIEDSTRLYRIFGAALQMQRELQWFKEVARIVNPKIKEGTNYKNSLSSPQLFTKNHENMMENGEKWMKDTTLLSTMVGALIATIMFAAAFTVRCIVPSFFLNFNIDVFGNFHNT